MLPNNIPNILLPPAFFTALFWVALWVWALGIVSIYVAKVYVIKKYNTHIYADMVTLIYFSIGIYVLKRYLGLLITPLLGLGIWLIAWVFFLKAANDFNACLSLEGPTAPALFAQTGSVFARESIHPKKGFLIRSKSYPRSDWVGLRLLRWFIYHNA